ncbi:MAG: hypothetical protein GTN62_05605 [Gemmatimonadales bacterium]|nr:hypothetical protein [Gemmatimonadales bacterium]NIN10980.1 hypothetical protein [Gemmatimonadales bacterium]NIN49572.1 hypothetical protein [Gemmatimonadales bacterium]NIP07036.1 hypothetical protein [Gemmatimonadales bacterium]NIR01670.1 hypothetical protein [Gemmatimonadales bacterium]
MSRASRVAVAALLATSIVNTARAQSRAVVLFGHGGRHFSVVNLAEGGDQFSSAFSFGGGLALQVGATAALRGSATYLKTNYAGSTLSLAEPGLARLYFGGDLQFGWPSEAGFVPYLFLGGGAVRTDPDDDSLESVTDLAGRFGAGFNRVAGLGAFFVEVVGWIYRFNSYGFDRAQFDVGLQGGLAFALPF